MGAITKMATLQVGDAVDIVLDGIGVRRGTVQALPTKDIVYVRTQCHGNPCDLGYHHSSGRVNGFHISRVKREKVNPSKMPKPILRYEQIDWGSD